MISEYWQRRKLGKRGQGDKEVSKFTPSGEPTIYIIQGKPTPFNREQRRRKIVDKRYTRHTRKGSKPVQHPDGSIERNQKYPSHMTNNMRMKMRELNRQKAFEVK